MVCRPSCGPCVGDVPRFACGRAGVEEIMGFAGSLGAGGEWYGYAFGFPDRHPRRLVACGFPDASGGTPSALWAAGRVRSGCVVV